MQAQAFLFSNEEMESTFLPDSLDLQMKQINTLLDNRSLENRLKAGELLFNIHKVKGYKPRFRTFKAFCNEGLKQKEGRINYILRFCTAYNNVDLLPKPLTIDQVKAILNLSDNETLLKAWKLLLIREHNHINQILPADIINAYKWYLGIEKFNFKETDSKKFIESIFNKETEKTKKDNADLKIKLMEVTLQLQKQDPSKMLELEKKVKELENEKLYIQLENYRLKIELQSNYTPQPIDKSPYDVLGVNQNDTNEQIKKAYKDLIKEYHPDKIKSKHLTHLQEKLFNDKFNELNQAYETIRSKRKF